VSAADRTDASDPVDSVAAACRNAGLVRLVGTADGDGLAAVGVLARALSAAAIPFQASVTRFPDPTTGTDADATVTVGASGGDVAVDATPASVPAFAAARELAPDAADPVLALAGAVAAGAVPGDDGVGLLEAARDAGVERRPGLALPVADAAEGLAHSTLVHLPCSGDADAARAALADVAGDDGSPESRKRAASMVALRAVADAPTRTAHAVERALRPYAGGPFENDWTHNNDVEGFYDPLVGYEHIDLTSWQLGDEEGSLVDEIVHYREASANADRPWIISIDEPQGIHNDHDDTNGNSEARQRRRGTSGSRHTPSST